MPFRISEVIATLIVVFVLTVAKHIPGLSGLPLSQAVGIICFSFAIYLSLRIYQDELARIRAE